MQPACNQARVMPPQWQPLSWLAAGWQLGLAAYGFQARLPYSP